ncbi:MAG: mechanosensitive ion channel domain-containing protein [Legionella sp.]
MYSQNNVFFRDSLCTKGYPLLVVFLLTYLFLFNTAAGVAGTIDDSNKGSNKLVQYLAQEKTNLTIANNNLMHLTAPSDQQNLLDRQLQNAKMIAITDSRISNLESFLFEQQKQQQKLMRHVKKLQQSPSSKEQELVAQEQAIKITTLSEVTNKTVELISDNLDLAHQYQQKLYAEKKFLQLCEASYKKDQQLEELNKRIDSLNEEKNSLYQKNTELQEVNSSVNNFNNSFNYESMLLINNQKIILILHRISELEIQKRLVKTEYYLFKSHDAKTIQEIIVTYQRALNTLSTISQSLKKMIELLSNEQTVLIDMHLKREASILLKTAKSRLERIELQQEKLQDLLVKREQQLTKQLSVRQTFTEYHLDSWLVLCAHGLQIPEQLYDYLKNLLLKVKDNYVWQDTWSATFYWLSLVLILGVAITIYRLLLIVEQKERARLSAHLYDGLILLVQRNIILLATLAIILTTVYLNHVPVSNYRLLVDILSVWLAFRNLILIARLILLERLSDETGKDVRLYYQLRILFMVGGWSTVLMIFSQQLPLSLIMQDIFNRVFMLFLLAVSVVAWKSKDVIPYLLSPFYNTKKRYLRNALTVLINLAPITLFSTALIGLVGYFNLAWTLSSYLVCVLLIISGHVLVRGLIFDALELLSEWMISTLRNGWLWIEVILKPLDKILRLLLILLSITVLFQAFGWSSDSWVMTYLIKISQYPFINLSGVRITLQSTAEFTILLFVFLWASKWTREFCYRWLYRNARDAGIRNSLSVFTQYAVILIGGFITLRVLGLDFSGMSMILGGLAVGMGFGLRDFASNIIGGLMLLIERPVREGDLITLGEYEGRVAHIGIRSMRVCSWDNMEVLIPNAETFNKPFTNWTHQDSVIRTVLPIRVGREDDPVMIQRLILDVLAIIPEILMDPAPQVLLKKIDEALIEFEVRYFINVQLFTRFEVQSKVLFAITAQFKASNIKPPVPPMSVEVSLNE